MVACIWRGGLFERARLGSAFSLSNKAFVKSFTPWKSYLGQYYTAWQLPMLSFTGASLHLELLGGRFPNCESRPSPSISRQYFFPVILNEL